MGINASKRVEAALTASPEFAAACDAVYEHCLDSAQHAFPGVRQYQLPDAAARLHSALAGSVPLVRRWVPSPPSRAQVDAAARRVGPEGGRELGRAEFGAFAADLFRDAVVGGAGRAVLVRVPVGIAGIAGVGMAARAGGDLIGRVMGLYAVGVVAAVYSSLS